jgi:hypothetical protein
LCLLYLFHNIEENVMTAQTVNTNTTGEAVHYGKLVQAALIAAVVAVVLNVVVYFIGSALGTLPESVVVPPANLPITVVPIVMATVMGAVAGTIVYALLGRFTARPVTIFRILGTVVLILSLAQPFIIPNVPLNMVITLDIMHIIAGAVIIYVLTTVARR